MASFLDTKKSEQEESHWLSVSDLMAGLMMVFLFIAIALMRNYTVYAEQYTGTKTAIYEALVNEFSNDLKRWDAEIDRDSLTFTFQSPDVLFAQGDTALNSKYMALLDDFFPRYLAALDPFVDSITEVRIEGHTSSVWNRFTTPTDAYFLNMELSQGRTRSVLRHIYSIAEDMQKQDWVRRRVAAVGLSSSHPVEVDGKEDKQGSRRVTFRIITNADDKIKQMSEATK